MPASTLLKQSQEGQTLPPYNAIPNYEAFQRQSKELIKKFLFDEGSYTRYNIPESYDLLSEGTENLKSAKIEDLTTVFRSLLKNGEPTGHLSQTDAVSSVLPLESFQILQKWEGVVEEIEESSFSAKLHDLEDLNAPEYLCEIPLEEISEADKELVKPGAIFYWHIFYKENQAKQKSRESVIRFRRLPWSKAQMERAERNAEKLNKYFKWESGNSSTG